MSGFREKIYEQSERIMQKFVKAWYANDLGRVTPEEAAILRECWTCSKQGNLLSRIVENVSWNTGNDQETILEQIIDLPGFLTKRELWYSRRVRRKTLTVYRGCGGVEDLGFSWTLAHDVAEFFAGCVPGGGKVITARARPYAWLDTAEHEIIALFVDKEDVVSVENPTQARGGQGFWDNRPTILPTQNLVDWPRK